MTTFNYDALEGLGAAIKKRDTSLDCNVTDCPTSIDKLDWYEGVTRIENNDIYIYHSCLLSQVAFMLL
ncbi:hypothetical protein ACN38_g7304 [Penicillium nordicum]|uniref:Uncharacterized protein n=1 Tax=Penicillium nordicum TaxID=229535 RepID=A0A0M9WEG8_9EURO|nr:hypothetical protein ACN38_g7304 [Penicillium nordicum]